MSDIGEREERMEPTNFRAPEDERFISSTLRDLMTIAFRHRRVVALSFLGVFAGAALAAVLLSEKYEARMKILVKHERVDPAVTSESSALPPQQISNQLVTEEDLNSELELITSRDLEEQVVETCGLDSLPSFWHFLQPIRDFLHPTSAAERIAKAVRKLNKDLDVELVPKTDMIEVTYATPDPVLSARVLTTLANGYLAKHLAVHRPPGAFNFFQQQTEQYQKELAAAEARLADFGRDQERGAVSPDIQKPLVLQTAIQFEAALRQAQASIAQTQERIHALEGLATATPSRLTTINRKSDNPLLLQQLKSTLLTLELQRIELLNKFEPSYRPVQQIEAQITQARAAIAAEDKAPVREETTDRNPTYQFVDQALALARADLASYQAQAAATAKIVRDYGSSAVFLDQKDIEHQDLIRTAKADEANYLLYLNKREEARISDALDTERIANVAIAEAPTAPALPKYPLGLLVLLAILLAALVSVGTAFAADYFDPSFRTADEVEALLNTPVLASMPNNAG
jgi:uncharacterized protein involved in exopolysaccharide biosynthesis